MFDSTSTSPSIANVPNPDPISYSDTVVVGQKSENEVKGLFLKFDDEDLSGLYAHNSDRKLRYVEQIKKNVDCDLSSADHIVVLKKELDSLRKEFESRLNRIEENSCRLIATLEQNTPSRILSAEGSDRNEAANLFTFEYPRIQSFEKNLLFVVVSSGNIDSTDGINRSSNTPNTPDAALTFIFTKDNKTHSLHKMNAYRKGFPINLFFVDEKVAEPHRYGLDLVVQQRSAIFIPMMKLFVYEFPTVPSSSMPYGDERIRIINSHVFKDMPKPISVSNDGSMIALGDTSHIAIFDINLNAYLCKVHTGYESYDSYNDRSIFFSPDGSKFASVILNQPDSHFQLWDVRSGKWIASLGSVNETQQAITSICFSPNGSSLASASARGQDRSIKIWDISEVKEAEGRPANLKYVTTFGRPDETYQLIQFSPDGAKLAAISIKGEGVSRQGSLIIWNKASGREVCTLKTSPEVINAISYIKFNADGSKLLSASDEGQVKIWDTTNGVELKTLEEITAPIINETGHSLLNFSMDSRFITIAYSGKDGIYASKYNIELGCEVAGENGELKKDLIIHSCFTPDGSRALSYSEDKVVRIWNLVWETKSVVG
ncbi:MAG: hypothetical protein HQK53_11740 [Oligoflexia bacterium]|nr:hypothetical protein [Oligoflexia bacterium]